MSDVKRLNKITNPGTIWQKEHVDDSDAKRVISGGYNADVIIQDLSSATKVGKSKHVLITNTSGGTAYVATGDSSVGVPTAADGIPVLNNTQLVIMTGADSYIRASAAVHGVVLGN